jgi:LysM repeat protein
MPRELLHKSTPQTSNVSGFWVAILALGVVAVLVLSAIVFLPGIFLEQPSPSWSAPVLDPTNILPAPVAKTSTPQAAENPATAAVEPSPTTSYTPTPASSATPAPEIISLPLETILGSNYKVLVHRIAAGESLSSLAQAHGTTDKTILDATYKLVIPLGAGNIVVIPLNINTWQGQPALEPYQISQQLITLDELGQLLGIDAKLLKYYNGCENCAIQQGSWVVIPRAP